MNEGRVNMRAVALAGTLAAPVAAILWWSREQQNLPMSNLLAALLILTFVVAPFLLGWSRFRRKNAAAREAGSFYRLGLLLIAFTLPLMMAAAPLCLISAYRVSDGGSGWCMLLVPVWWAFYAWVAPLLGLVLILLFRPERRASA